MEIGQYIYHFSYAIVWYLTTTFNLYAYQNDGKKENILEKRQDVFHAIPI